MRKCAISRYCWRVAKSGLKWNYIKSTWYIYVNDILYMYPVQKWIHCRHMNKQHGILKSLESWFIYALFRALNWTEISWNENIFVEQEIDLQQRVWLPSGLRGRWPSIYTCNLVLVQYLVLRCVKLLLRFCNICWDEPFVCKKNLDTQRFGTLFYFQSERFFDHMLQGLSIRLWKLFNKHPMKF